MSPIEKILIAAILERTPAGVTIHDYTPWKSRGTFEPKLGCLMVVTDEAEPSPEYYGDGDEEWALFSNVVIADYKIDLILRASFGAVAIECDGHDWHDRTKQQAAYDRARDRYFAARLLPTIRFTGSEIHHSVERCVSDALAVVTAIDRQAEALAHAGCSIAGVCYRGDD